MKRDEENETKMKSNFLDCQNNPEKKYLQVFTSEVMRSFLKLFYRPTDIFVSFAL
jgi:hypothetical protein